MDFVTPILVLLVFVVAALAFRRYFVKTPEQAPAAKFQRRTDLIFMLSRHHGGQVWLIEDTRIDDLPVKLSFVCDHIIDVKRGVYLKSRTDAFDSTVPSKRMTEIRATAVVATEEEAWLKMTGGRFAGKGVFSEESLKRMRAIDEEVVNV
jgi:hypothetical protein